MLSIYARRLSKHLHPFSRAIKDPSASYKSVLITSALPYVNNVPHLGNLIGSVLSADVFARYQRSIGTNTIYICGTDEYGTATEVKAMKENKTPKEVCDKYHLIHKKIYQWFDISFDYFGRTSTSTHQKIVQGIFKDLDQQQLIVQRETQQHYCSSCKLFLADRYIGGTCPQCQNPGAKGDQCESCNKLIAPMELIDVQCLLCKQKPDVRSTTHLYVKIGDLKEKLEQWLEKGMSGWSHNAKCITNSWVENLIAERSISRDLKWGVPIPKEGYENKVFYVWFDAPIGYISLTAELLPDSYLKWWTQAQNLKLYQFMGKDNVPFHSIIFPACLMGTSKPYKLVDTISATEHLLYEGTKFSKSAETGIFCDTISQLDIDVSSWRYYLLYNRPQRFDRNFQWKEFLQVVNRDMVNNIGNLFQRVLNLVCVKLAGNRAAVNHNSLTNQDLAFLNKGQKLYLEYIKLMANVQLKQGLMKVVEISSHANKYLQDAAPWTKNSLQSGRSEIVIQTLLNYLCMLSTIMQPFVPGLSRKACSHLGGAKRSIGFYLQGNWIERLLEGVPKDNQLIRPQKFVEMLNIRDVKDYQKRFGGTQF